MSADNSRKRKAEGDLKELEIQEENKNEYVARQIF
jgi:hypothetical protein